MCVCVCVCIYIYVMDRKANKSPFSISAPVLACDLLGATEPTVTYFNTLSMDVKIIWP